MRVKKNFFDFSGDYEYSTTAKAKAYANLIKKRREEKVDIQRPNASENNHVNCILPDGMYYSKNNFRYLSKNHIKPSIKIRSN